MDAAQPNKNGPFERNIVDELANKTAIHIVINEKVEMMFKIVITVVQKIV